MRWPHESAITRRDEHLARTRKLSVWIAGGATAASFGLAAALGFALPGHTATTSTAQSPGQTTTGSTNGAGTGTATGKRHHHRLAPPQQAPAPAPAPPTVTSGGS